MAFFRAHPLSFTEDSTNAGKDWLKQGERAKVQLEKDERSFSDSVDKFMNGNLSAGSNVRVMNTPLALKAAGAPLLPVEIRYSDLNKILKGKHAENIDSNILKGIPRALTHPVMIFKSYDGSNGNDRLVAMLEIKDKNGATVVVPFELKIESDNKTYRINLMKSAYGKTDKKTGFPSAEYFKKQIESGNVLYADKEKTAAWAQSVRLYQPAAAPNVEMLPFTPEWSTQAFHGNFITDMITRNNPDVKTEVDLQKLRQQYPSYYQSAWHGTPHRFEKFDLGAIGTGEGAQAHGWGLYFAQSKEISENYRKALTKASDIGYQFSINGKNYIYSRNGGLKASDNSELEDGLKAIDTLGYSIRLYPDSTPKHEATDAEVDKIWDIYVK